MGKKKAITHFQPVRGPGGSAFDTCLKCGKSVPAALFGSHGCGEADPPKVKDKKAEDETRLKKRHGKLRTKMKIKIGDETLEIDKDILCVSPTLSIFLEDYALEENALFCLSDQDGFRGIKPRNIITLLEVLKCIHCKTAKEGLDINEEVFKLLLFANVEKEYGNLLCAFKQPKEIFSLKEERHEKVSYGSKDNRSGMEIENDIEIKKEEIKTEEEKEKGVPFLTEQSSAEEVQKWLLTGKRGQFSSLATTFSGLNGESMLGYSKEDLKGLVGPAKGIALYNALHPPLPEPKVLRGNDSAPAFGWIRDLTNDVEPNPGLGWMEFANEVRKKFGEDAPLDKIKKSINLPMISTTHIQEFLLNPKRVEERLEIGELFPQEGSPEGLKGLMEELQKDLALAARYSQLEEQKKIFGEALIKALPIETPHSALFIEGNIKIDPFYFVDGPGCLKISRKFITWVQNLAKEGAQEAKLGAVYNVSGAGKSKLCATYCMLYGGLFITQGTKSFEVLREVLGQLVKKAEARDKFRKDTQMWKEVHEGALRLVELWIASYIAFIWELKEVHKEENKVNWMRAQITGGQFWIAAYFRGNAYLAASKHEAEFTKLVNRLFSWAKGNIGAVVHDDIGGTYGDYRGLFLHSMLAEQQSNDDLVPLQFKEMIGQDPKDVRVKRPTDLSYAIVLIAEKLSRIAIPQLFTSTRMTAFNGILDEEKYSRQRLKFDKFYDLPRTTAKTCISFFTGHFDGVSPLNIKQLALKFENARPLFFYGDVVLQHVNLIFKEKKPDAKNSEGCANDALWRGIVDSENQRAQGIWERIKNKHELLVPLYYFQMLHNGYVAFEMSADSMDGDPIDTGLAPLQYLEGSLAVGTLSEYFIRKSVVSQILDANYHQKDLEKDHILKYFRTHLITEAIDKKITEKLVAWVLKRNERNSLLSLLSTEEQSHQGLKNNHLLSNFIINVDRCGSYKELELEPVTSLSKSKPGIVIFPHQDAKPDLWLKSEVSDNTAICGIQVRNWSTKLTPALFESAMETLNPANFFAGASKMQAEWVSEHANVDFSYYVRVVVVTQTVHANVYDGVHLYNKRNPNTPIIVLSLNRKKFIGELIQNRFLVPAQMNTRDKDIKVNQKKLALGAPVVPSTGTAPPALFENSILRHFRPVETIWAPQKKRKTDVGFIAAKVEEEN